MDEFYLWTMVNMNTSSRVVARHLSSNGEPEKTVVYMADGGVITTGDLERLLRDRVVHLGDVSFLRPSSTTPSSAVWQATTKEGQVVLGTLTLKTMITPRDVTTWGEIVIGDDGDDDLPESESRPVLEARLAKVDGLARDLIEQIRTNPSVSKIEIVQLLTQIVEVVEGE